VELSLAAFDIHRLILIDSDLGVQRQYNLCRQRRIDKEIANGHDCGYIHCV
jgi:hypothetical protein